MKIKLLDLLRCPVSGQRLKLEDYCKPCKDIDSGWLISEDRKYRYAICKGIPRFVEDSNYTDSFGMQWNLFRQTQLDSFSGHPISANRFWDTTAWAPEELEDKWVLDVGCGAGRFAEVALEAGAKVVAMDYSSSVDACFTNLKHHPNLHVVQGDIYSLPFLTETFSFVYSIGVLQHTPDVARAFLSLPPMARRGGRICVDYYEKTWKSFLLPKYWFRPITKRLPKKILFKIIKKITPLLLHISRRLGCIPILGNYLKRIVPVANYYGILPLSDNQYIEWSILDTFDMFSPQYDNPQTIKMAYSLMVKAGLREIEVLKVGHLVARGKR